MQAELERGHDAEVAAAPDAPEQFGVFSLAGRHELAVSRDQLDREQVVDGQAIFAAQMPQAAAQRQPAHTGGRDVTSGCRQAEDLRLAVHSADGRAALDADGLGLLIDVHALHERGVDHDPAVTRAAAGHVVAAAAHGYEQLMGAGKIHAASPSATPVQRAMRAGCLSCMRL